MIVKIVLGKSLKSLIGELKLSYRRIFRIIGESLAAVRKQAPRKQLSENLSREILFCFLFIYFQILLSDKRQKE